MVELENTFCALCGSDDTRLLVIRNSYRVVQCRRCSLVYVNPRPASQEEVTKLYTDAAYCDGQVKAFALERRLREARERAGLITQRFGRPGRLLDVGCSTGMFLRAAREQGWEVHGLDVSPGAIAHARATGLDASVGTLELAEFPPGSFDAVTLFDCLEHMLEPIDALRSAWRLLKTDGLLIVTTPNIDGFSPQATYRLLGKTIGAWEHPIPPHHLYQFSRRTLLRALGQAGFRPIACHTQSLGVPYTAAQMEEAIIEALKVRMQTWRVMRPAVEVAMVGPSPAGSCGAGEASRSGTRLSHRVSRWAVRAFSWTLTLALYTLPVSSLGFGDSMIVVARKRLDARASEGGRPD